MPTAIITDARGIIEAARFFGSHNSVTRRHPDGPNVEPNPGERLWWLRSAIQLPATVKDLPKRYRLTGNEDDPVFTLVSEEESASQIRQNGLALLRTAYTSTLDHALGDPKPTEAQAILERGAEARRFWDAHRTATEANVAMDKADYPYLNAYRAAWVAAGASEHEVTMEAVAGELLSYDNIRRDFFAAVEKKYIAMQNRILAIKVPAEDQIRQIIHAIDWPDDKYLKQASYSLCYMPVGDQLDAYSSQELESTADLMGRADTSLRELCERKKQVYDSLPYEARESKRGLAQKEVLHLLEEASLDMKNALAKAGAVLR